MSCTTTAHPSTLLSARHRARLRSRSRTLSAQCPGSYSPQLLLRGPMAKQVPYLLLVRSHFPCWPGLYLISCSCKRCQTVPPAARWLRATGGDPFSLHKARASLACSLKISTSSPSTASLCLQANNCCPSHFFFSTTNRESSFNYQTGFRFYFIKFCCCYPELLPPT